LEHRDKPPKGIYILPNLLTTASLFAAFYAIIQSTVGNFSNAAIAVIVAAVLDMLDGRVARMTNTASDFGKEYDSLVDLVAFGLAPALILFEWGLQTLGKSGWLVAFTYVATTALRLARFNTQEHSSKRYFQGLPCPAAAVLLAAAVWTAESYLLSGAAYQITGFVLMALLAFAMVSGMPYRSFKDLDLKHRVPFVAVLALVLVFVLISFDPPAVLLTVSGAYAISGAVGWFWLRKEGQHVFQVADEESGQTPAQAVRRASGSSED
jgi:CDP-diacylglycerol--serine O-phosphatidyltransferase|tara:strand:+ start:14447 stop:15244 length:798 start_codon:yes stop_codon:yes gene_type:complete